MTKVRKITAGLVGSAIALALVLPVHGAAAGTGSAGTTTQGTPGTGTTDWLTDVNAFREMAGLGPVVEDTTLSDGASKHSCYMLRNGMTHDEVVGRPGYTPEGANAGASGNVAVSSSTSTTDRAFVELWMTGPFHAIGVLQPHLTTVGYGRCNDGTAAQWRAGATLDIITDIRESQRSARRTAPILFPGDGAVTTLDRFIAETPDPRDFCGYPKGGANPVGLPVIAMMPERLSGPVTGTISGPSGLLESCTLSQFNTGTETSAPAILGGSNAIVVVPRRPLAEGTYTVTAGSRTGSVSWSFTVDADAALGLPAPIAAPVGAAVAFQPLSPTRVIDTTRNIGATPLKARVTTTLQIGGQGGVPLDASAVSANFTVLGQAGWGYLTVWDCNATMPVVSTVNFRSGEVAPNAATVPLAPGGRLCVYSTTDTHLLVDVNGAYGSAGTARFTPLAPVRLMDSREGHGTPGRLRAGQTVPLTIAGANGVPSGVSAVTLNVTSTNAASDRLGYVTAHACDTGRPLASNLNPTGGRDRPNLVIVPVASDGSVCLYTDNATDLVVDLTGYLSTESTRQFTATAPFRFVDTRDGVRPEVNQGTRGRPLPAGRTMRVQMAGVRGVPAEATAVSLNLTVTDAQGAAFITAWPCGDRPEASTANFAAQTAVSNGAQLPLSDDGALCLYSPVTTHVVVDVNGWWS